MPEISGEENVIKEAPCLGATIDVYPIDSSDEELEHLAQILVEAYLREKRYGSTK